MQAHNIEEGARTEDIQIEEQLNFESLLLSEETLLALKKNGFRKPSPIQLKAIPLGRCGFDLIVKSKSGTGKTAVFGIIALEMIKLNTNEIQVLILAPTREIAVQIVDVLKMLGNEYKGLKVCSFIGGLPMEDDLIKLECCHIAVGAPGRVKHLIDKNAMKLDNVRLFVLDEADKLMESSYQSDINQIYHKLPLRKQMLAVSATYPDSLDTFLGRYMHNPTHVSPLVDSPLLLGLKQCVAIVKSNPIVIHQMNIKNDCLIQLLSKVSFTQCLIFSNFQTRAESISNTLNRKGWNCTFISGAQTQVERLEAVNSLKEFKCRILLSTDLTARGIDASNVDLVINYDVPHDSSTYLHRMGRAGRYGAKGICINLASKGKELLQLQHILGTIGGHDLSLGTLPEFNEFPTNLWDVDFNSFKQLNGVIDEHFITESKTKLKNIKESVFELKQSQNQTKQKKLLKTNQSEQKPDVTKSDINQTLLLKQNEPDSKLQLNKSENILLLKQLEKGLQPDVSKSEINNSNNILLLKRLEQGLQPDVSKSEINNSNNILLLKRLEQGLQPDVSKSEINNSKHILLLKQLEQGIQPDQTIVDDLLNTTSINTQLLLENVASGENINNIENPQLLLQKIASGGNTNNIMDPQLLLQNMASGENINNIENPQLLLQKIASSENIDDASTPSKRKRENDSIFQKNVVLLNISKLLFDKSIAVDIPEEITDSIDNYLKIDNLKENEIMSSNEKITSNTSDLIENVFKFGYNYAIKPNETHWLDVLGEEFDENVITEQAGDAPINLLATDEDYEDQEDFEEISTTTYRKKRNNRKRKSHRNSFTDNAIEDNYNSESFMQWTAVEPAVEKNDETQCEEVINTSDYQYTDEIDLNNDQYTAYFNQYSQMLAEKADTFESVETFDAWLVNWQQQIQGVRDYIQQNVYMQEMNNYQYYKDQ